MTCEGETILLTDTRNLELCQLLSHKKNARANNVTYREV